MCVCVITIPYHNDTIYFMIGILASFVFWFIYGVKILNPAYTEWLLTGGELSHHYMVGKHIGQVYGILR